LLSQPKKNDRNKIDKLINEIKVSVNVEGVKIDFDNLSKGEKKLILIESIIKVLGDENSLILLDEPDAHTHIAMKKDLLKLISEFKGQTIMTTHSPMFLNKRWDGFDENNIFYMHDGKIENTESLKHLAELTDNEIDYFEGSFILSSKNILVTEGPYDILYLKHAIDKFADENPDYLKLKEQVAFMHAGGANNAKALYQQTLYPFINKIQKLVFIFDYDREGFEGAEILKESMSFNNDTKPVLLFYQDDYSTYKTRKPNDKDTESYMAEDLFDRDSYINVTNKIHVRSHKELRNMTWNDIITSNKRPKGATDAIKYYIQDNYASFEKEWLQNFKPVLDKLLDVFDLN
jgi:energy-coupling factor transporter ATP-binding protein EcfA2